MNEIKLEKRYPHSRTEDIVDAYMRGWNDALDAVQNGKFHIAEQTEPNCSEIPNNCEPQTYVINPQEPTNDEKCFECDDFFTCGGQCNKIEDEPHAEIPEYAEWKEPFEKMTDCPWK